VRNTTLIHLERDGKYLMLHRVKKEHDENRDKWVGIGGKFEPGESPEDCAIREVKEELGMTVQSLSFLRSRYYAPTETLMLHYAATVAEQTAVPNWEVDSWEWVSVENALALVRPGSLAETFLKDYEQYRKHGT
jgi:8-oxo-dGTP pyrophosphatase MutT (NUDIX family)